MKRLSISPRTVSSFFAVSLCFLSLLFFAQAAVACPTGVAGKADPGSTVCAESSSGILYCVQTDSSGDFFIGGGSVPPSTGGCLPLTGSYWFYQTNCYDDGMSVNYGKSKTIRAKDIYLWLMVHTSKDPQACADFVRGVKDQVKQLNASKEEKKNKKKEEEASAPLEKTEQVASQIVSGITKGSA